MKIGIDISQIAYEGTGVGRYVREMVLALLKTDHANEYILFGASLRQRQKFYQYFDAVRSLHGKVKLIVVPIPPILLEFLWNTLHMISIKRFIGDIDIFWSSDWTQPPLPHIRGMTTIHDVSFLHFPESFDRKIIAVQKRRLAWAKKECQAFLCDSEATKKDVMKLLNIEENKIHVVYPGFANV